MRPNVVQEALSLQQHGFRIIPLKFKSKIPSIRWKEDYHLDTRGLEYEEINTLFKQSNNVGAVLGEYSDNIILIDWDDRDMCARWTNTINPEYLSTPQVESSRGIHFYYRWDNTNNPLPGNWKFRWDNQLVGDIKSTGGICVLPPSLHDTSTHMYRWLIHPNQMLFVTISSLEELNIQPMYGAWNYTYDTSGRDIKEARTIEVIGPERYAQGMVRNTLNKVESAAESTRNSTLYKAASEIGRLSSTGYLDMDKVITSLEKTALGIGLGKTETKKTIQSGIRSGSKSPILLVKQQIPRGKPIPPTEKVSFRGKGNE